MDFVLIILKGIAILICIYLLWQADKKITKTCEVKKMIVTNKFSISFRIPDDADVMREFENSNDLTRWLRSESTEYVTYTYIIMECRKRGKEDGRR